MDIKKVLNQIYQQLPPQPALAFAWNQATVISLETSSAEPPISRKAWSIHWESVGNSRASRCFCWHS